MGAAAPGRIVHRRVPLLATEFLADAVELDVDVVADHTARSSSAA